MFIMSIRLFIITLPSIVVALIFYSFAQADNIDKQPESTINQKQLDKLLVRVVDEVIIPRYIHFRDTTLTLKTSFDKLCFSADEKTLSQTRTQFLQTAIAWGEVEMVRVGAINTQNRFERILFYPDRKSTGLRQVQAILHNQDQRALSIATLQKKSVATQGLGALEFILFGTNSQLLASTQQSTVKQAEFRCHYGRTVSQNINIIANEVVDEWQKPNGIATIWKTPNANNQLFRNRNEALNEVIGILINNLKIIHDIRLGYFLAKNPDDDRPKRAIYRRSANTFLIINANIRALQELFVDSGIAKLLPSHLASIEDSILFEFRQALLTSSAINLPVEQALLDKDMREKINYLSLLLTALIERFDQEFAPATGLSAGFSFSDGD